MFIRNYFFLLTAPPAWGKTRLFRQWVENYQLPFIYISPLRALANEVMSSLEDHPGLMKLKGKYDVKTWNQWSKVSDKSHILVVTPEQLGDFDWQGLADKVPNAVVVWDEVHLLPLWGFEFRDRLLQQWWSYITSGLCGVGLTATADKSFLQFLKNSLMGFGWNLISGDAGNFEFKNRPTSLLSVPSPWLRVLLHDAIDEQNGNTLVFCEHRDEVDQMVEKWSEKGFQVLGCKGGETVRFQEKLINSRGSLVIFSTSCLSHGVNLPRLKRVILLYQEKNPSMFHQMITRGGRKGESFEVLYPWPDALPVKQKIKSVRQLLGRVFVAQVWQFMGEWWHGTRRFSRPGYSPKRA